MHHLRIKKGDVVCRDAERHHADRIIRNLIIGDDDILGAYLLGPGKNHLAM